MIKLIKLISIVLVGITISVGAFAVGYQIGKADQVNRILISLSIKNDPSEVLSNQQLVEIPETTLEIYSTNCASCHGTAGQGSTIAPALDNPDLRARLNDSEIKAIIADGRPGTAMPAWKNKLTESQISALSALIRNWGELDTEQLSGMESQTPCGHGMGNWQRNNPMMGCGGNSGMGHHPRRSP